MFIIIGEIKECGGNYTYEILGCFYSEKNAENFKKEKVKEKQYTYIEIWYGEILDEKEE